MSKFPSILANGHIRWCTERSLGISEVKHDRDMSELGWVTAQPSFLHSESAFFKISRPNDLLDGVTGARIRLEIRPASKKGLAPSF